MRKILKTADRREKWMKIWTEFTLKSLGALCKISDEFSKRYFSCSCHPISAKLSEDIGYHGGIQAVTLLGNQPSLKNVAP